MNNRKKDKNNMKTCVNILSHKMIKITKWKKNDAM